MKNYKLTVRIDYYEPYLPPRCRKYRYEWKNETIKVPIRTITSDEAPMVYKSSDIIRKDIGPTVDILKVIKPLWNFKAKTPDR